MKPLQKTTEFSTLTSLLLLPVLYYLGARLAVNLTVMTEDTAVLWPPNSLVLAAFLLLGWRYAGWVTVLALLAEIVADLPGLKWYQGLCFGIVNVAEAAIAAVLLQLLQFDRRFSTLNDVLKFIIAALLFAALCGAFLGAGVYKILGLPEYNYFEHVRILWFGDGLGLLIFTPLWLSFWPKSGMMSPPIKLQTYDYVIMATGLIFLSLFMASDGGHILGVHGGPTLLLPFLIYVGVRFEVRWAAVVTACTAIIIILLVHRGQEPFGPLPRGEAAIQTQEFIFIMSLLAMGSGALLTQVRSNQAQLETAVISLNELNHHLEARIEERTADLVETNERLQQAYGELERLANLDGLTGIANRRTFEARLHSEWARAARESKPMSLILLDIDHFKKYNDGYGHQAGDACLKQVAAAIGTTAKRPADLVARYGGEEFAIILPETDEAGAAALAEQICAAIRALKVKHEFSMTHECVTISAGMGTKIPAPSDDPASLVRVADQALYRAKELGRNCFSV